MSEDRLCTVKVDWFQPVTNPPVKRFIVQFKTDKKQWQPYQNCGNNEDNSCLIPIANLTSAPYFLMPGRAIEARVISVNILGKGIASRPV